MAGGWLAVFAPLSVLPGVLAAGDAPALTVALVGILLSTWGGWLGPVGGALAAVSVAVKPIALPALLLLAVRPASLIGAVGVLILLRHFISPLWSPMPHGGLLGTWWVASGGSPPQAVFSWAADGLMTLMDSPHWAQIWWLPLGAMGVLRARSRALVLTGILPLLAAWGIAAMFGGRMEARYLSVPLVVALPFLGALLADRRVLGVVCACMTWATVALITQLGAARAAIDSHAQVPELPVLSWPAVEADAIFQTCSTEDATRLRELAIQLAEVAPKGSTIITEARPDGREGELFWPLKVLRPDIKVSTSGPEAPTEME